MKLKSITVRPVGFKKAVEDLEELPNKLVRDVIFAVQTAVFSTHAEASQAVAADTGYLGARIQIEPIRDVGGNIITGAVDVGAIYGIFVEYGTGPLGARTNRQELPRGYVHGPAYFPPPSKLQRWAERHKIEGGGYAVARAIFRNGGTRARPFLGPAARKAATKMQGTLDKIFRKGMAEVGAKK